MMNEPMFSDTLERYLEHLVPPRVGELARMEAEGRRTGLPIIGPSCGHFCYLVARLIGARRVFEMGSGYGYSTVWFAQAVAENGGGQVIHTVMDQELSRRARGHFAALGLEAVVDLRVEEAVAALERESGPFDLIFVDIDKESYLKALEVIETKLRPGGVLIADNMLMSGAVLDNRDRSPRVTAMHQFTQRVMQGDVWTASIVPLRDGLLLAWKRP
jgi:predicted O-methyltransferase YrrM